MTAEEGVRTIIAPKWRKRRHRAAPGDPRFVILLFSFLGGLLFAFVLVPLVGLVGRESVASIVRIAGMPDVRHALALSLEAAFLTAAFAAVFGIPLAYLLVRTAFPGKPLVAAVIDIPLAVPHTVVGIALLVVLGRRGILGAPADALFGLKFWGTIAGVVAAMLFVAAPYTVNAARIAFEGVDPRLEKVARTLGMGPWRTLFFVTFPLSWRGIMTGITLTFARSISEFGAVVILAYYPMTAPVQIYDLLLRYGLDDAAAAAVLLLIVCAALFVLLRYIAYGTAASGGGGR